MEIINYMTARHPKFQVQADGWGSAHGKKDHSLPKLIVRNPETAMNLIRSP
jgi:hypothetical protein